MSGETVISSFVREQIRSLGAFWNSYQEWETLSIRKGGKTGKRRKKEASGYKNSAARLFAFVLFSITTGYHSWAQWGGGIYIGKKSYIPGLNSYLVGNHESLVELCNFQYKFFISKININFTKGFRDGEASG